MKNLDGDTYYFDKKGNMVTGWKEVNGKEYYFHETSKPRGRMAKNETIDGKYLNGLGEIVPSQWLKSSNGRWWYKHGDGSYTRNNFEVIDGDTYYFDDHGYMVTGWKEVNGKEE